MKRIFGIGGAIIVMGIALFFAACRDVDTGKGDFTRAISVHDGDVSISLDQNDPVIADLKHWIQSPDPRWRRSLTTYAPNLVVRNAHFSLNVLDDRAVLNFQPDPSKPQWIQVVREYDSSEPKVMEQLRATINQAGGRNQLK